MHRPSFVSLGVALSIVSGCGDNTGGGSSGAGTTADPGTDATTGSGTVAGEDSTASGAPTGAGTGSGGGPTTGDVTTTDGGTEAGTAGSSETGTDTGVEPGSDLDTALGCPGVYNPDQILDLHLEMAPGDWQTVKGDLSFSIYVEAQFHCGDEAPLTVGVRRKRSGGTHKVGLKVDFNKFVMGQRWQDLRKLSLENGVSSGDPDDDAEVRDLVGEYLGWRVMQRAGVIASRAAFSNLYVNQELIGVYVDVEQVDTRFLKDRFGDNDGWLVKKSGGDGDGPQTHEDDGMADPFAAYFCFWGKGGQACDPPADDVLLAELPGKLDIVQFLRFGAANAYIANTDGPLFKDNNWYYYDWSGGGRAYMPTDLDTTMKSFTNVLTPDGHAFDTVLFTHWMPDYEAILTEIVEVQAPASVMLEELDRVLMVAGPALDGDPWANGTTAAAVAT
ncbi:MAG TPA: CotH kinase family protein, partial [Nannocystis sp.]